MEKEEIALRLTEEWIRDRSKKIGTTVTAYDIIDTFNEICKKIEIEKEK